MFIQTEPTPNPATLKFIPGKTVLGDGTVDFRDKRRRRLAAGAAPVRHRRRGWRVPRLGLHLRDQGRGRRVAALKPAILGAIMEHFMSGAPVVAEETRQRGEEAYDRKDEDAVRPSRSCWTRACGRPWPTTAATSRSRLQGRRGLSHMRGACSGCPSSTATLRHGIENLLKHFCPDVQEVRPI